METARLRLRGWDPADLVPFAALNADSEVMRYFPSVLTSAESNGLVARIQATWAREGFGLWAVEHRAEKAFIGYVGLARPRFEASFTPCVEVGWRLSRAYWGQGLAPEGALQVLRFAFDELGLGEILSWTAAINRPSIRVMEKIGMVPHPLGSFEHPLIASGDPLRPHVLYRIAASQGAPRVGGLRMPAADGNVDSF